MRETGTGTRPALTRVGRALVAGGLLAGLAGCAASVAPPPPIVTTPRFPNFVFPAVPAEYQASAAAGSHERAWLFLQAGDLGEARRGFDDTLRQQGDFYPATVGLGYVDLAERAYEAAVGRFTRALDRVPTYVPALVGRGEALLATRQEVAALDSFEAALAADPSLDAVQRRVQVLRFRGLQAYVDAARQAAAAGRVDEARRSYERALQASPDSAFLHRELASLQLDAGSLSEAVAHARRATALDSDDAAAFELLGDIEAARGAFETAVDAYERAALLAPDAELDAKRTEAAERAEYARLPPQYRAIAAAPSIARGGLAALVSIRLRGLLAAAPRTNATLITDTRDHWAASWIMTAANVGVMEVYANHTFQPELEIRRGELARVTSRVLDLIGERDPALARRWTGTRVQFADLGASHLSYAAASRSVAAGVLGTLDGNRFDLSGIVSGAEAVAAVERLEALADQTAGRDGPR
jgi:tetratricopeptide (TPR) repeat protein